MRGEDIHHFVFARLVAAAVCFFQVHLCAPQHPTRAALTVHVQLLEHGAAAALQARPRLGGESTQLRVRGQRRKHVLGTGARARRVGCRGPGRSRFHNPRWPLVVAALLVGARRC